MTSTLEQASADLKVARFVVHKLGETFDSFQVHSCSIFNLVEQWRNLQASFGDVHKTLENRVKDLELKEREFGVVTNKLENFQKEVELKRKKLEFGEKLLSEKIEKVELRQNEVNKWLAVLAAQKRGVSERGKAVEAKEKELLEGFERVKKVDDDEARVRKFELDVDERRKAVELEESRVNKVVEEVERRKKGIDERCKAVELRENRVDERCKELEAKEMEIKEREEVLEGRVNEEHRVMEDKEKRLMKDCEELDLREREMDEINSSLESRENEIDESFKRVESIEKELKVREEAVKVQCEELKAKEKDVVDRLDILKAKEKDVVDRLDILKAKEKDVVDRLDILKAKEKDVVDRLDILKAKEKDVVDRLDILKAKEKDVVDRLDVLKAKEKNVVDRLDVFKVKEKDIVDRSDALKVKEKDFNERFASLRAREEKVNERSRDLEHKAKQVNAQCMKMLALKGKEEKVEELRQGLELMEKQVYEDLDGLELKQNQLGERRKEIKVEEKKISERYKEIEIKEKQINRRNKALELREKQFEDSRKGLELREKQYEDSRKRLELKEHDVKLPQVVESQEDQFKKPFEVEEAKENQCIVLSKSPESKEKQCINLSQSTKSKEKQINVPCEELDYKEKQINLPCEAMESKWKQIDELAHHDKVSAMKDKEMNVSCQAVELKENQVNDATQKYEMGHKELHNHNSSEGDSSVFCAMDGKMLQLYLNERASKHESMKGEVAILLKSTSTPAKLVLDAIDGFFAPHLSKNGVTFKTSDVRSSCLLLLEHLMNMKPQVTKSLKKTAKAVAVKWRAEMRSQEETEDVALAFSLLLVTFNLTSLVKKNDLRRLYGKVNQHRLAPRLRLSLDLVKRTNVSRGIRNVIKAPIQLHSLPAANALYSPYVKFPDDIHSLCTSMDRHGLRSYLLQHVNEHNVLQDKVLGALRYASDPAKLVLDVCQLCVTDCPKKLADVNSTTCVFLLEQLMKLCPSISHEVTYEAESFAAFLKARLKGNCIHVDSYIFLQFLASYNLASSYNPETLLLHFEVFYSGVEVYRPEEHAYLCRALGLAKRLPGFIKTLINKQKLLSAVKFICVFKLEDCFDPVALLEAYWESITKKADQKRKEGTSKDKIDAESLESSMLTNILTCISNFNLESKLPPDRFLACMKELERRREIRMGAKCPKKRSASPRPSAASLLHQEKRPRVATVQQIQTVSPVYLPPCPLEPPRVGTVQQNQTVSPVYLPPCPPGPPRVGTVQKNQTYFPVYPPPCPPGPPRVWNVQQNQTVSPVYLPPCHPGPPPRSAHCFGGVPHVAPGHFTPTTPARMYPVHAPYPFTE